LQQVFLHSSPALFFFQRMTSESPAVIKKVPVTAALKKKQPKSLKQRALEKELGKTKIELFDVSITKY
jgi:hypothetical protein